MKMTDQMERDYFQAELANGSANRQGSDNDGLKVASVVMTALVLAALLMIYFGG